MDFPEETPFPKDPFFPNLRWRTEGAGARMPELQTYFLPLFSYAPHQQKGGTNLDDDFWCILHSGCRQPPPVTPFWLTEESKKPFQHKLLDPHSKTAPLLKVYVPRFL